MDLSLSKAFDFDPVSDGLTGFKLFVSFDLRPNETSIGVVKLFNDFESTDILFVDNDSTL